MSESAKRVNAAIELGAVSDEQRPERVNPAKGTTSYPFGEVAVGQVFYVARTAGSVRVALKRWLELHKDEKRRFETWKGADGRVVVKRTK